MKNYVVGFLFDDEMRRVLLIHKNHGPRCVVGLWNGVGGHIEPGESPYQAMIREFEEEAGVRTQDFDWQRLTTLISSTAVVHFFWMRDTGLLEQTHDCTDEETRVFGVDEIHPYCVHHVPVVPNLRWMIPFLCDKTVCHELPDINFNEEPVI